MHNTAVWYRDSGTTLPKGDFFKSNLNCIKNLDNLNDADELKIKFWASWNNNVDWAAQKDFVHTCQLFVVQDEHFHKCWQHFCLNTSNVQTQEGSFGPSI